MTVPVKLAAIPELELDELARSSEIIRNDVRTVYLTVEDLVTEYNDKILAGTSTFCPEIRKEIDEQFEVFENKHAVFKRTVLKMLTKALEPSKPVVATVPAAVKAPAVSTAPVAPVAPKKPLPSARR